MCKQKYTVKFHKADNQCQLENYYKENRKLFDGKLLPVDEEGYCLFHSTNWVWKRKKKFAYRMKQLLNVMLKDREVKSVDFRDFQFVPDGEDEAIVISDLTTTKDLNLSGTNFKGGLTFQNNQFSGAVYMDVVNMEGVFTIEMCVFTTSFTAIQNACFHHNVYMQDVIFHDLFDLNNSKFFGQLHFSDVTFKGYTVWDHVVNQPKAFAFAYFSVFFQGHISFKHTEFHVPVQFENCSFEESTHFEETQFKKALYLTNPTIRNVVFRGTPEQLIFEHEVEMQIRSSDFEGAGQLIFEHANLINLDKHTKQKLASLKSNRQVVLGEGTIVFRVSFQEKYPYSDLNELFLHDLLTTIRQYFKRKLSKHFEFVFTQQKDELVVTFFTDDYANPDDFRKDEQAIVDTLSSNIQNKLEDKVLDYLQTKFSHQVESFIQTAIKKEVPLAVLDHLLGRDNLDVIIQTGTIGNINQVTRIESQQLNIGTVQNSQFYIARLMGMKNDPVFQMSPTQFGALKKELSNLNDEAKWTELKLLLENIKENQLSQEELLPFLSECGVSIANNLSSSVLFVFLNYLLMGG